MSNGRDCSRESRRDSDSDHVPNANRSVRAAQATSFAVGSLFVLKPSRSTTPQVSFQSSKTFENMGIRQSMARTGSRQNSPRDECQEAPAWSAEIVRKELTRYGAGRDRSRAAQRRVQSAPDVLRLLRKARSIGRCARARQEAAQPGLAETAKQGDTEVNSILTWSWSGPGWRHFIP
jgi:hypothetical protein